MRLLNFSRHSCALGLVIVLGSVFCDTAWSQGGRGRNRGGADQRDQRGDPTSLLTVSRESFRDNKELETKLNLTEEQKGELRKLRTESYGAPKKVQNADELAQFRKDLEEKAVNLLNDDQKQIWKQKKEELLAEAGKTETPATEKSSVPAAGGQADQSAKPFFSEEKPPGAKTVISFGPAGAAKLAELEAKPKAEEEAKQGADAKSDAKAPANEIASIKESLMTDGDQDKLQFNFMYAPWADVLKLFAEINDLSLDLNDVPPGTFNYWDNQKYTMTEAMDVLNGYLLSKGYCLVRRDRFLVCLDIEKPIPPNVIPSITEDELQQRGRNELLTLIMPLKPPADAAKVADEIQPLLGPQGKSAALKSTNSLFLTDIGSNLRRITNLLKMSEPADTRETTFKSIALKHIAAADAERVVRRHFGLTVPGMTAAAPQPTGGQNGGRGGGGGGGRGGWGGGGGGWGGGGGGWGQGGGGGWGGNGNGGGNNGNNDGGNGQPTPPPASPTAAGSQSPFAGKIQVTADTRSNYLLVTAKPELIKVVEELVKILDTTVDSTGKEMELRNMPVSFMAYSAPGSDVAAVSRMLSGIVPGAYISEDARAAKIYVQATADDHEQISRLLKTLGDTSNSVRAIPLTRLDPIVVQNQIRNLFINESPRGPSVEADVNGRRLLVRATPEQMKQIEGLLHDLGETNAMLNSEDAGTARADRGRTRRLPLGNHDPEEIRALVQGIWGGSGHPIQIVIPSETRLNPIRDGQLAPPFQRPPFQAPPTLEPSATDPNLSAPPVRQSNRPENRDSTQRNPATRTGAPKRDSEKMNQPRRQLPATTQLYPRRIPVIQASQTTSVRPATKVQPSDQLALNDETAADASNDLPNAKESSNLGTESAPAQTATPPTGPAPATPAKPPVQPETSANENKAPIVGTVVGNDLIITSEDQNELDQFEDMFAAMTSAIPPRPRWTAFYLRTADATECARLIEQLMPQSSVTTPTSTSESPFMGFAFGQRIMNSAGLNQTANPTQSLRIIPDLRSNALFVSGPPDQIRDIKLILERLDSGDVPGALRGRFPRTIPVLYADVEEVKTNIEELFKDVMTAEQPQQNNQFNPFAMFGGNRGGQQNQAKKGPELTVTADTRTNHLIVSCNEGLFNQVRDMVLMIDMRAKAARPSVEIVSLKTADPLIVQSTLTSLMPRISVSTTQSRRTKQVANSPSQAGQPQQPQSSNGGNDPQAMQRMMPPGGGFGYGMPGGAPWMRGGQGGQGGGGGGNRNRGNRNN